jgi:Cytochrome c554 and c-prime
MKLRTPPLHPLPLSASPCALRSLLALPPRGLRGLAILLGLLPLLGPAACERGRSSGGPGAVARSAAPTDGTTPAFAGRGAESNVGNVGVATVRLYLLSDLAGALEPCGCTRDQLGGLDHFGAWVKREHAQAPASLVAAAGPLFFMDDKLEGERADQDRTKAETIARVLGGLGFVAFAPGANDWDDGPVGLSKLASVSGSAVIAGGDAGGPLPSSVSATVRDAGGIKVGFVGFGQTPATTGPDAPPPSEPRQAVARGVAAARQQGANVLVALVSVGRGEAKRIAEAIPELTVVVVGAPKATGDGNTTAAQPERVGDVLVVQGANHLQAVSVLDLFVREPVAPGVGIKFADATGLELSHRREEASRRIDELHIKIAAWQRDPTVAAGDIEARKRELAALEDERAGLDVKPPPSKGSFFRYSLKEVRESSGKDPSIEEQMRAYYKAVDDHNRVAFADRLPPPRAAGQAGYVGITVCATCHARAAAVWNGTAHSHAYETLASQFKEFNLECVSCHVTGYERPGGSTVTHVDKLTNVQCEVCHGPGSKHAANPKDVGAIVATPGPDRCLECHHSPHVEQFDPSLKIPEILGPGHGLP